MPARRTVAVVGPADASAEQETAAYDVGFGLAGRGLAVVTGGLGGVMAAASHGCAAAGGVVLGILPGTDVDDANEFVDLAVPTGLGQARNVLVVRAALAVVAVGGSWGTLSEIAIARRLGRPVVSLGGWQVVDASATPVVDGPLEAADADDAVRLVAALLGG
jgi:uncharacterized protein (TIGR00725 family)